LTERELFIFIKNNTINLSEFKSQCEKPRVKFNLESRQHAPT